ncbi:VWA domain-containing protein [Kiritimatiellota bacterium B12222]|nr:VWA domain-containing protein [Kiritimatiellota bacterium B12222]
MKFAHVWILVLIPVVVGLCHLFYLFTDRRHATRLQRFLGGAYTRHVNATGKTPVWRPRRYFHTLCLVFLLVAVARPYLPPDPNDVEERQRVGVDMMIALDASKSMLANDALSTAAWRKQAGKRLMGKAPLVAGLKGYDMKNFRANRNLTGFEVEGTMRRLTAAKESIFDLLTLSQGDRMGLIAFTEEAALRAPLTYDFEALSLVLDSVSPATVPPGGSALASAITRAISVFEGQDIDRPILVVLSDGEDHEGDAMEAAMKFRQELNGVIYTVGVGTSAGSTIPITKEGRNPYLRDQFGRNVHTRLDKISLTRIARATGGRYVDLGEDGEGLQEIYLQYLKPMGDNVPEEFQGDAKEYYQIPLGLSLVALLFEMCVRARPQVIKTEAVLSS